MTQPPKTVDAAAMLALAGWLHAQWSRHNASVARNDPVVVAEMNALASWENAVRLAATAPTPGGDWDAAIELGDFVEVRETARYYADWCGTELKVIGLRIEPNGHRWASVIEGEPRHRGNGVYDSETTDFDADDLRALTRPTPTAAEPDGGEQPFDVMATIDADYAESFAAVTEEQLEIACKAHYFCNLQHAGLSPDELDGVGLDSAWDDIEDDETREELREAMKRALATLPQAGQSEAGSLRRAIDYALATDDGLEWLRAWSDGDPDASLPNHSEVDRG